MQAKVDPTGDNPKRDMRRLHAPIRIRNGAGFDRVKREFASVHVTGRASKPGKVWVWRPSGFGGGVEQPVRIGLPNFDQRIAQWGSGAVKHGPAYRYVLTLCLAGFHCDTKVMAIVHRNARQVWRAPDMHIRPSCL